MARAVVIVVGGLEGCCDVFWYQARKKDTLDRSGQEGEETLCNSVSLPSFFSLFLTRVGRRPHPIFDEESHQLGVWQV